MQEVIHGHTGHDCSAVAVSRSVTHRQQPAQSGSDRGSKEQVLLLSTHRTFKVVTSGCAPL